MATIAQTRASVRSVRQLFATLPLPTNTRLTGIHAAEFTGPNWLISSAALSLIPMGFAGWCGKRFDDYGRGMNLAVRKGRITEFFPMSVSIADSLVDNKPCVALRYSRDSRFPLPAIVDEFRQLNENCLLGMMVLDYPLLRRLAFPFLLTRVESIHALLPDNKKTASGL